MKKKSPHSLICRSVADLIFRKIVFECQSVTLWLTVPVAGRRCRDRPGTATMRRLSRKRSSRPQFRRILRHVNLNLNVRIAKERLLDMKRNNVFFCVAFTAFLLAAGPVRAEEGRPISRYEEVSFGRPEHSSGSRQKNYGKIEREYRFPRSNFSRYFHPHKPKDEVDFRYDIFDRKYDSLDRNDGNDRAYETRYVKLPNLERTNVTEGPPRPENTLERYKNLPTSAEFVTSKNHHRKANGSDQNAKTFGDFQGGIFTKINTVIRDQFKKIFKPKEPPQAENTPPPFDSPETPGAERKFSKFSKNHTRYGMIEKVQEKKNKRFLNIFTILQFENSRCQAQGSFLSYEGTCYHRNECAALGGFSMGACAKGYGVCCVCKCCAMFLVRPVPTCRM